MTTRKVRGLKTTAALLAVLIASGGVVSAQEITFRIDIPPQPLVRALEGFAQQTELQVAYLSEIVEDIESGGFSGEGTVEGLLQALLEGSGLAWRFENERTVLIIVPARDGKEGAEVAKPPVTTSEGHSLNSSRTAPAIDWDEKSGDRQISAGEEPARRAQEAAVATEEESAHGRQQRKFTDEITVTSTRRERKVREVPGSVSVVEGFELEAVGATSLDDYASGVPGINYIDSSPQQDVITMRGIGTSMFNNFLQPTVSTYVNEIPLAGYFFPAGNFDILPFDLERVEFLKGPQGTLYGSASLGGVVRYLLNRPSFDRNGGALNLTVSNTASGGTGFVAQGMFNVVLAKDRFAIRGVVTHEDAAGWIDHETLGEDFNTYDQTSGRLMASWTPSDTIRFDAAWLFQNSDLDTFGNNLSSPDFDNPFASEDLNRAQTVEYRYQVGNGTLFWDLGFAELMSSTSFLEKSWGWTLEDGAAMALELMLLEEYVLPFYGVPVSPGDLTNSIDRTYSTIPGQTETAWFQEFRLVSEDTGRLDWIVGLYYADAEMDHLGQTWPYPGIEDRVNELAPGMGTLLFPNDSNLFWKPTSTATELALYGELGIDLSDRWKLNVGGRYTDLEKKDDSVAQSYGEWFPAVDDPPVELSVFAPKVSLSYTSDDMMWYGLVSRGYRAGGVNGTYLFINPDATEFRNYDTDDLWNYETGIRKTWVDGKINTDVTVFYLDWSDIQLDATFVDQQVGYISAVFNTSEARSVGAEAVISAQLTRNLSLQTAIMWNEAELASDTLELYDAISGEHVVIPKGARLPTTPEWSTSTTFRYSWLNESLGYPWVALEHAFKDSYFTELISHCGVPSHTFWNLQLGTTLAEQLQLTLVVRNLLDERAATNFRPEADGSFVPNAFPENWWITRPRTISLTAQWNY